MERKDEIIMVGPAFPIRPSRSAGLSNQKSGPRDEVQLSFAPGAISVVIEDGPSQSLANEGFNSDEPRIPAGQPGGGRWTKAGEGTSAGQGSGKRLEEQQHSVKPAPHPTPSPSRQEAKTNKANPPHATATGAGTRDHLVQALKELDTGYAKEVADIMGMRGITEAERAAGLKSLKEKYEKAPGDLSERIDKIEQTAEDLAFAYGGKASDYYKYLDDSDPKVQELMGLLDHLEAYGFKDAFLLALRHHEGGPLPPPSNSHVLNAALQVAMSVVGPEGSAVEKRLHAAEKSAVEEAAAKAGKLKQFLENIATGVQRAAKTAKELADENPGKAIQHERTLRDVNGNKVLDPVTGEGRRVDHVVIDRDANSAKTYETTGGKC